MTQVNQKLVPSHLLMSIKKRSEASRQLNNKRNRRAHEDFIEMYNITDPDTTPSDISDDDNYWCV